MSLTADQVKHNSGSSKTFATALVANAALLFVEVGAFIILKQKLQRIYSPRTFLPPPEKRASDLPKGTWRWLPAVMLADPRDIIHKNGLDAYMFLRFLKMLMWIFAFFTFLTFLVILPADAANTNSSADGLDRITWSNIVDPKDQNRYWAHIVVTWVLTFFVFFMIRREMLHFVHMRHQFLISPSHSRLAQARTVLITAIPETLDIHEFSSFVPGGVDRVWMYRDSKELNEMHRKRTELSQKLEAAESKVLKMAMKEVRRRQKLEKVNDAEAALPKPEESAGTYSLAEFVPQAKRPMMHTGLLGLLGSKVDTITHCTSEISRLNKAIETGRSHISTKAKFLGSAFIRCNLQIGAHVLAQCVSYHEPFTMYDKWLEAHPDDVVWDNLDDGFLEMKSRLITSWIATFGLIILWGFPVAFIGTLSNIDDVCLDTKWLEWICKAPAPVPGIIQGVIPPALLAILFAILPFILKGLAWYECIPRYSLISISVYKRFFLFLLVHGFLIVTLSSGITKALKGIINNPASTVEDLAQQLPGASVFFLTYIVTQGLAGAGAALAQLVPLVLHFVKKWLLGETPRQAYAVTFLMPSADFGTILPRLSLLATITFAYSVLSPLINLLALICFSMYYLAWKLLFMQVLDQPDAFETGGLYFPMAVSNLFIGLYIEQICLACLYFLKSSEEGQKVTSIVEGILMLVLFVVTVSAQISVSRSFDPITKYLPMSLATKKMAEKFEKQKKKVHGTEKKEDSEEMDLFSRNRILSVRRRFRKLDQKLDQKLDKVKAKVAKEVLKEDKAHHSDSDSDSDAEVPNAGFSTGSNIRPNAVPNAPVPAAAAPTAVEAVPEGTIASQPPAETQSGRSTPSPAFDAPAAAGTDLSDIDSSSDEDEVDLNEHAFDHPSTYVDQRWIWIPRDPLGLSKELVKELHEAGVDASDEGADMNLKGIVEVTRNPPDEEWSGGHDR